MVSGLQCPIALWSGLRSENDPQPSTDTTLVQRGWEEKPERATLMWRSANTFTSGTAKSPADLSGKPHTISRSLFDSRSRTEMIQSSRSLLAEFSACRRRLSCLFCIYNYYIFHFVLFIRSRLYLHRQLGLRAAYCLTLWGSSLPLLFHVVVHFAQMEISSSLNLLQPLLHCTLSLDKFNK